MQESFGGKPDVRSAMAGICALQGAEPAARRLLDGVGPLARIAVTDHAPMHAVRALAVERGITVVSFADSSQVDLIVTGSVAVTARGHRCGAGRGATDLAIGIARERGAPVPPVATLVDPRQIVRFFPTYEHDVDVSWIATPETLIEVPGPHYTGTGIRWDWLGAEHYALWPQLAAGPPFGGCEAEPA
jgi:hypothetical protein